MGSEVEGQECLLFPPSQFSSFLLTLSKVSVTDTFNFFGIVPQPPPDTMTSAFFLTLFSAPSFWILSPPFLLTPFPPHTKPFISPGRGLCPNTLPPPPTWGLNATRPGLPSAFGCLQ